MVVLAPKCVLCVAGYFGVGTALRWTGAELCGGPDRATPPVVAWPVVASVTLSLAALAARACGACRGRR